MSGSSGVRKVCEMVAASDTETKAAESDEGSVLDVRYFLLKHSVWSKDEKSGSCDGHLSGGS